jgi:hypothetical protein
MGRTAARQQHIPIPTAQNAELKQPAIRENDHSAASQPSTPFPAPQKVEPKQRTVTDDDVRLRAYEIYLQRGDNPGDDVGDWLQAERELLGG